MSTTKEFTWQSEDDGKKQYHEFYAHLEERLGMKSCEFVLDPLAIQRYAQPLNCIEGMVIQ